MPGEYINLSPPGYNIVWTHISVNFLYRGDSATTDPLFYYTTLIFSLEM